jgi:hypothetical protein
MTPVWVLICAILTTGLATTQGKDVVGDFTKSPTEHIINQIEPPFIVRSVKGTIIERGGYRDPLPDTLFEIQGPGRSRKMRRRLTDERGQFCIGHVPAGTYKFKATRNGFQSVMGTIVVSKKAAKTDEIKIEMKPGV